MGEKARYALIATDTNGEYKIVAKSKGFDVLERMFEPMAAYIHVENGAEGRFFKTLELVAQQDVYSEAIPTDTLAEDHRETPHVFSYKLILESADGETRTLWLSDDLERLTVLAEAFLPLVIEDNRASAPGEHYTRLAIMARDVLMVRNFEVPEGAGAAGPDTYGEVDRMLSRLFSQAQGGRSE